MKKLYLPFIVLFFSIGSHAGEGLKWRYSFLDGKNTELGPNEEQITGLPKGYKCFVSKVEDSYTKILNSKLNKIAESFMGKYQRTLWCEVNGVYFDTQAVCGKREGDIQILSFSKNKDKHIKIALLCNPEGS